jgi:hypothetical protein
MVELVLTPEQMASLKPGESVFLRSPDGELVGRVDGSISEVDLQVLEQWRRTRHLPRETYTTEQVLQRLRELGLMQ